MDLNLTDKVAVVTGGGRGVGAAIGEYLASEGVRVAIADVGESDATATAERIGGIAVGMDIRDREQVDRGFDEITRTFGGVHILVSNAGVTLPDPLTEVDDADVEKTLDVNLRGAIYCTRAAARHIREAGWGRLIYVGSTSGLKASGGLGLYSASKYFLHGLATAAGLELGRSGITANIVCPSDIYPEEGAGSWLNEKLVRISCEKEGVVDFEAMKRKRTEKTPAGRSCRPADVASLVTFLASPVADFINAQAIGVNGGSVPT